MNELDPRLLSVAITVNNRVTSYNQNLAIRVTGMNYANPLQDEAEITIYNLDRATQDFLLTETSPYNLNRSLKEIVVYAGRASYGQTVIYRGNVVMSMVSQPPDIGVTLKCLNGASFQGSIYSVSQAGNVQQSEIVARIAKAVDLVTRFEAPDKTLHNYVYNGTAIGEIGYLNTIGGANIFIHGAQNALIVKGWYVPLHNTLRIVSQETGMIGIPEFNELGIKVKFFIDSKTTLGGAIRVISQRYPAFNGDYVIYKLGFDLSSRDIPFYYIAEAARIPAGVQVT